jgi:hypothetical protein
LGLENGREGIAEIGGVGVGDMHGKDALKGEEDEMARSAGD